MYCDFTHSMHSLRDKKGDNLSMDSEYTDVFAILCAS